MRQSTRADSVNLFGFVDHTGTLGMNASSHWSHRLKPRVFLFTNYAFSRLRTEVTPNFAESRECVGQARASAATTRTRPIGVRRRSAFRSAFAGLSDGNSAFNRNRADSLTASTLIYHGKHNMTVGGEFRKQEYNDLSQQNPRGTFGFTGAATAQPGGSR